MSKFIDNRYYLLKSLEGNNAHVLHAIDKEAQQETEVVVKLFSMNHNHRLNLEFFNREIESLSRLDHPNIVRFVNHGRHEGSPYLVMDYIQGETLEKFWAHRTGDVQASLKVLSTLFDAISHAHAQEVVHRDLKPSNILVDDDEQLHIIDFGTSKILAQINMGTTVRDFITVEYASPEQLAHSDTDYKTDLYSLGAIGYWLLTGKVRRNGEELSTLIRQLDIKSDVKDFLAQLTEVDPDERPASAFAARRRLQELCIHLDQELIEHFLVLTPAAVQKLFTLGEIIAASETDAREHLQRDLGQDVYVFKDVNTYYVLGRRCKFTCSIDPASRAAFLVKSISVLPSQILEGEREKAVAVSARWTVVSSKTRPGPSDEFALLLDRLQVHAVAYERRKQEETSNKDLVNQWESVLRIQRQLATYNGLRIDYVGYRFLEQDLIEVTLAQPVDELLHDTNQTRIFAMSPRNRYARQVDVGTYVDLVGSKLKLLVKRGLTEEVVRQTVSEQGYITVNTSEVRALLQRQQRALDAIKHGESVNNRLPQVLRDPKTVTTRTERVLLSFRHSNLDDSKQNAVRRALATNDIFLVQGPPGTGKTTFIAELVYQILEAEPKARLLITSQSHVAVDQALEYVAKVMGTETKIVRVGREDKVSGESSRFMLEQQLQTWVEDIKDHSNRYAEAQNEALGADNRALSLLRVVDEVDICLNQVATLSADLAHTERSLEETRLSIKEITNAQQFIEHLGERLQAGAHSLSVPGVIQSVVQFRDTLAQVAESFLNNLATNADLYQRHEELSQHAAAVTAKLHQLQADAEAGFELLIEEEQVDTAELSSESLANLRRRLLEQTVGVREALERRAHVERVRQEWLGRLGKQDELDTMFVNQVQILAGTCVGVAPYLYRGDTEYDWVIIDEAARATPPELLVPAVRGKRIVLVGDHHQLPPMLDRNLTKEMLDSEGISDRDLEKTLFEYLFHNLPENSKARLTDQWRMHPGIGDMISTLFYDRTLVTRVSPKPRSYGTRWGDKPVIWRSTSRALDRFEQSVGTSFVNRYEVKVIDNLLSELDKELQLAGLQLRIGVIAGYASQKEALLSTLDPLDNARWSSIDLRVGTVDAFQGQETDVILYSMVRSNREKDLGFLSDARRLNVALSRARHLLVVVGDHELASSAKAKPTNPYADVVSYMAKHPEYCIIEGV